MTKANGSLVDALVAVSAVAFVLYTIVVFGGGHMVGKAGNVVTVTETVTVERMPWLDHYDWEALMQCVGELDDRDSEPEKCFGVLRAAHDRK